VAVCDRKMGSERHTAGIARFAVYDGLHSHNRGCQLAKRYPLVLALSTYISGRKQCRTGNN